jgi:hypothetical protein
MENFSIANQRRASKFCERKLSLLQNLLVLHRGLIGISDTEIVENYREVQNFLATYPDLLPPTNLSC